jgi:hypothetical protein
MKIVPASEGWAEGLAFLMPSTNTWGGLRWQRQRSNSDGNFYIGYTALDSTDDLVFGANNGGSQVDNIIRLVKNGNVGIGSSSPAYKLDVSGTIRATGDVIAYSDARVKDNVETVKDALQTVTSLRGVTYTRKDNEDKSRKVGVIAQEVLSVLPEVVQKDNNGNYSVAYGNMVGVLIEAIKELTARIEQLENK